MLLPGWGLAGTERKAWRGRRAESETRGQPHHLCPKGWVPHPVFPLIKTDFAGLGKGTENSIPSSCSGNDHGTNTHIQAIFVTLQNFGLNLLLLMGRILYLFRMALLKSTDLTIK